MRHACILALALAALLTPLRGVAQSTEQTRQIQSLARAARGTQEDAAWRALRDLAALGEPAHAELRTVLTFWLDRDARLLQRASASTAARLASMQRQQDAERTAAWAVIDQLTKDTVLQARQHHDRLVAMHAEIAAGYARLAPAVAALARRAELMDLWTPLASAADVEARASSETELLAQANEALPLSPEEARRCLDWSAATAPTEGVAGGLRLWFAARAIDAYNARQAPLLSKQEQANAALVNRYRVALGTLPLEWDPRVIQSARRHSKEMAELNFFDHESPTPANKTHTLRMRNAGHPHGGAENIAMGSGSGEGVFWMWFDSPGHHKNMVGRGHVALGVGQWGSHWTQNFAGGPRQCLRPLAEQKTLEVQGAIVPPK